MAQQTSGLRLMGNAIFLWTFVVLAALYRWLGDGVEILVAAGVLFLLQAVQAIQFYRLAAGVPWRFWKATACLLLPQHAIRAADPLGDAASAGGEPAHPLAARKLMDKENWQQLAAQFWKRTRYQRSATADLQSRVLATWFEAQGVSTHSLEPAPERQGDSAAYCPSCQAQFREGTLACKDCDGVELRSF